MTNEKLDAMMTAYCDPDAEQFTYHEKKHKGLRSVSVIAAALVLMILGTLIIPSLTKMKHSFVLTVNAEEIVPGRYVVGSNATSWEDYDADGNLLLSYSVNSAIMVVHGEDIADVAFKSVHRHGNFELYGPGDGVTNFGWVRTYDADGRVDPDFVGWPGLHDDDDIVAYSHYADTEMKTLLEDFIVEEDYIVEYDPLDINGYWLQTEDFSEDYNDIVEITVTFTDGETQTRRLSVTYPDGVMTVEELDG